MIYVSTSCLSGHKISEVVEQLANLGFTNIELSGGTSYYPEIFDDLRHLKRVYGLNYACHSYFPPPRHDFVVNLASGNNDIHKRSVAHYMNCIKRLQEIDCTTLSIHAGFFIDFMPEELGKTIQSSVIYDIDECIERFCESYDALTRFAGEHGVTMYLENNVVSYGNFEQSGNISNFMMDNSSTIIDLSKRLEYNLLLDLGHLFVSCNSLGKDFETEVKILVPYTKWFHISENDAFSDQHKRLLPDGPVTNAYFQYKKPDINITIETRGSPEELLSSYDILMQG